MLSEAKTKVAACGRRWGKSESEGIDLATYFLVCRDEYQGVIAPSYDQTNIIFNEVVNRLSDVPGLLDKIRIVRQPVPGIYWKPEYGKGHILARSANRDARTLRGFKFHRVKVDEAGQVADSVMDNVVGPTLADYDGQLSLISTPFGMNHFYRTFMQAHHPDFNADMFAIQLPSWQNPYLSKHYLFKEKKRRPQRAFQQEYLALFLSDIGGVFRNIEGAIDMGRAEMSEPVLGHQYVVGWDLARIHDYSVIVVIDLTTNEQVYFDRFNLMSWRRQVTNVESVARTYNNASVIMDTTGLGEPVYESLRERGVYTIPYHLTNSTKSHLIDNAAMIVENAQVSLMDIPTQTMELRSYAYERLPSGVYRTSAPDGYFDDCVIALSMALWGMAPSKGWWEDEDLMKWLASDRTGPLRPLPLAA